MKKQAIAVFNPQSPIEQAIQNASHAADGEWLGSYQCKLMANAISTMKCFDEWEENTDLLNLRVSYLFSGHMIKHRESLVFVTHMLFLRDILDNKEINGYLHDPIIFMSRPLAYYLFREYPIHLHVNTSVLKADNKKVNFTDIGGFVIVDNQDIVLNRNAIDNIVSVNNKKNECVIDQGILQSIKQNSELHKKVAVSLVGDGVFKIDEHERTLKPDMEVWHKENRATGNIFLVESGESGLVGIRYNDGAEELIPKESFDNEFIVV